MAETGELRAQRTGGYESPRPDVQQLVPMTARRVLDLGCASGTLGAALKARQGCGVVGIELLPEYARDAETRIDRVLCGDVLEVLRTSGAELGTFDCVIAADVLEHLVEPWEALRIAAGLLGPGGTAVVSLPNVRSWQVLRAVFLGGRWPREPAGPLDGTHLRWFTLADARELLEQAGLTVTAVHPNLFFEEGWRLTVARALGRTPLAPLTHGQYVLAGVRP